MSAERELIGQAEFILTEAIRANEVRIDSAMAIVAKGMEIMERFKYLDGKHKKALLVEILNRIAAGKDGVVGTADDMIPASTMAALRVLLEGSLLEQTTDLIMDITRGKFNIGKAVQVASDVAQTAAALTPPEIAQKCPSLCGLLKKKVVPS